MLTPQVTDNFMQANYHIAISSRGSRDSFLWRPSEGAWTWPWAYCCRNPSLCAGVGQGAPRCPFQVYPFSDFELHQALIIQLCAAGIWNPKDIWYSLQYDHGLATSPCDKWSLFSNQSQTEGQSSGWKPAWVSGDQHLLHKGQCKLVHLASLVLICEITALPKYLSVLRGGMFWSVISPIITPSSKEGCLAFWNGQVNNAVPSLPPMNNVFTSNCQTTIHHALISFHAGL